MAGRHCPFCGQAHADVCPAITRALAAATKPVPVAEPAPSAPEPVPKLSPARAAFIEQMRRRGGRAREYRTNAERQRAYRERKKRGA